MYCGTIVHWHKSRAIPKNAGLSLRELAKQASITPSMLSQIEKGHSNPSIQTLKSLAKVLMFRFYISNGGNRYKESCCKRGYAEADDCGWSCVRIGLA